MEYLVLLPYLLLLNAEVSNEQERKSCLVKIIAQISGRYR